MDYYSVMAQAVSRSGAAGFVKAYTYERDSEVTPAGHDALLLIQAAKMKRAKLTGPIIRAYVDKQEYVDGQGFAHWIKAASLSTPYLPKEGE